MKTPFVLLNTTFFLLMILTFESLRRIVIFLKYLMTSRQLIPTDLDTLGQSASHMVFFGNPLIAQLYFWSITYPLEVRSFNGV